MSKQFLVQARISQSAYKRLETRANSEGVTLAFLVRHQLEAVAAPSLYKRVRALEVALIKFGVVPEGVRQL